MAVMTPFRSRKVCCGGKVNAGGSARKSHVEPIVHEDSFAGAREIDETSSEPLHFPPGTIAPPQLHPLATERERQQTESHCGCGPARLAQQTS